MRFGVLGPLSVWTADGRPVRVPELKVRALLAALLARQGEPVSADRLIDDLWGDELPGNPAGVLQNKVWQLRRALEHAQPGGRDLVASLAPGYQLLVADDAVDAGRFGELTARARAAADPRVRATLLADALALWRGGAFADFADEEFVRVATARLEEQRLTALEEQAEARIELGEHALVADELGDLVALHPLRERLRTAQIRALYLAGRQSAALRSYEELRERLADQLGVDPGPGPAALHRAILTQDPALAAVPSPDAATARPPSDVPSPLTDLIGRDEAVDALREALAAHRLVTLTGPGGVGKTQLAFALARRLAGEFPGGVRLVEFAALDPSPGPGATEVRELVATVLGVRGDLAAPPATGAGTFTDRVVHVLGDRPVLLVLDNCEHVAGPVAALVRDLLGAKPGLRVLATGQTPLQVRGEWLQEVPPLTGSSAVELFTARARAAAPHLVLDESHTDAVASICRRLDGIPLALEMAATRVRVLGVTELATRLDDRFHLLASGVRGAPARQRTLRAVIDWSWELLGDEERTVLRRLAVHADGCTLAAAEEICPTGTTYRADVVDLLARLVGASLVVVTDTADGPRYRLLESVTAYCVEHLRDNGELAALQLRHRDHYTRLAERAEPHLRGHGQRQWLRRLDAESANFRTALESAAQARDAERALRLVNALAWYWHLRGRYSEAQRSLAQALSLTAAVSPQAVTGLRDPHGPARAARVATATAWHGGFGLALGGSADPLSEYRAALEPYERVADPVGKARAQWYLGSNLYGIGDPAPSRELVARALATFRSQGDQWGTAAALASQAFQAKLRGDFPALRRYGEQSLELFADLGDGWGQLQAMVPLQTLAEVVGDYPRAGRLLREGLRMAQDLSLWPEVSFQLTGVGRIALLTGDLARAREYHERARRLAVEQSDTFGEQYAEIGLGMGARREGRLDTAEAHMVHVLRLHRKMGYEPGVPPLILAELGFVAEARGQAAEALRLHLDGLAAARTCGDPRAVALALEGLAGARLLDGQPALAAGLLGAAAGARASVGVPLPAGERGDVDRISRGAREALGDDGYEKAFRHGGEEGPDAPWESRPAPAASGT
ncbi:AfsR/SARP family transcriptional regulator [Streptomyces yaizuensis]|uniref:Winged helix-turn-helix domain-containing protein n=1 Tax=Streptomyces yaizuensis TaxID=2989713 RepID=A0ABQ5PA57_9ACTN|nr:BTAD domain-containing putative transcriptional regulator [Streptomyces sp. YSPA8]GLF99422.1 winged helix-turn-helix domain-containing protein [Streptomyces sp. YSPA8]